MELQSTANTLMFTFNYEVNELKLYLEISGALNNTFMTFLSTPNFNTLEFCTLSNELVI